MGQLCYGSTREELSVPDRLLAHLKVVATTKLRRQESFTLSWVHPDGEQPGRSAIWVNPAIELRFHFQHVEPEELDKHLLEQLAREADTNAGIHLDLAGDESSAAPMTDVPRIEAAA
jgi:hypothetical protein